MSTFKVGEVVEGHRFVNSLHRNGMAGQIVGPLKFRAGYWNSGGLVDVATLKVLWADGQTTNCAEHNLRKRRPPGTDEAERLTAELFDRLTQQVPA